MFLFSDHLVVTPDLSLPSQRPSHLELVPQTNLSKSGSLIILKISNPAIVTADRLIHCKIGAKDLVTCVHMKDLRLKTVVEKPHSCTQSYKKINPLENKATYRKGTDEDKSSINGMPSSPSREINKLKDQLEQQAMQTRQALAQLMLVREQLITETNARIEAQARTQQLLQQNRELLEHLASLGAYNEQQASGLTTANIGIAPQELLNRLQALNLGASTSATLSLANGSAASIPSPHNSFFFVNPMSSCSPSNNNNNASNNYNFLNTPTHGSLCGNLTPSPMGTLNRNSYSNSPVTEEMRLSIDKNLNALDEHLMKPLTQLPNSASNGNLTASGSRENSRSSSTVECALTPMRRSNNNLHSSSNGSNNNNNSSNEMNLLSSSPRYNTVMLRVTDESGNITNQRKISATPSYITRSTSEKVPNRSQIMSQVQRTAWARHTTK
uniref:Uncharacterized protein n=1 Tax=Glossina pallidipes TaxID=7398 RepID=A0A1A9ZKI3_GLOPL